MGPPVVQRRSVGASWEGHTIVAQVRAERWESYMLQFGDVRNKVVSLLGCYGASEAFTQTIMSLNVCYPPNTQKMPCLSSLPHFEVRAPPSGSRPANQTAAGLKQVKQADWVGAAQFLLYLTGHGATMAVNNCVKYLLFFFNLLFWVSVAPAACWCSWRVWPGEVSGRLIIFTLNYKCFFFFLPKNAQSTRDPEFGGLRFWIWN